MPTNSTSIIFDQTSIRDPKRAYYACGNVLTKRSYGVRTHYVPTFLRGALSKN